MLDLTEPNSKSTDSHNNLENREEHPIGQGTDTTPHKPESIRRTRLLGKKQDGAAAFKNYAKRVKQLTRPLKPEETKTEDLSTKLAEESLFESKSVQKFYSSRSHHANVSNNSTNTSEIVQKIEQSIKHPLQGEENTYAAKKPRLEDDMLNNGYRINDGHNNPTKSDDVCNADFSPIATLLNIGNTCYLNSVIYTLRFTPFFLHNLHHLVDEITQVNQKLNQAKLKSSSLGRNMGGITGSSSRSWSSKDLPALGNQAETSPKSSIQIASEKLHELFHALRDAEIKDNIEPFQADTFLRSVQEVNTIFEGNQQQDAHELLMCVLDLIRETCSSITKKVANQPDLFNGCSSLTETPNEDLSPSSNHGKFFFNKKSRKRNVPKTKTYIPAEVVPPTSLQNGLAKNSSDDETSSTGSTQKQRQIGFDFITQDFQGVTVSKTTCLTCETVTERKQPMCDIPVPILEDGTAAESASKLYQHACVTSEYLRDQNKYFCEECLRYCEARRSVSFDVLPRLLILQLKRFSGGMEKISTFVPTPLTLSCFCNKCCDLEDHQRLHRYKLYSIISHVGATMSVGHYIAYTRALDLKSDYIDCDREKSSKPLSQTNLSNEKSTGFKKMFSRSKSSSSTNPEKIANGSVSTVSTCPGLKCCGIKFNKLTRASDDLNTVFGNEDESAWFVCDDERVKQISSSDFEDLISNNNMKQTATPYLLFYVKSDIK